MDLLIAYALQFVGTSYRWGGNNAVEGFDCSGFVQELLASVGIDPPGRDTAQTLFNHFNQPINVLDQPKTGALVFYGEHKQKVTHIAFCIDENRIIEAGGGNRMTLSAQDAAKQSATVRMRLWKRRTDVVAILMPNYPDWILWKA